MKKVLNVGLIGLHRGNLFFEYSNLEKQVQIIGICDLNSKLFNLYPDTIYKTSNYEDFLILKNLDAVYIATPPESHAEISSFFLEHNISVLCEVPACLDENEANSLREIAKTSSAIYMMAENYCFIPENLAIQDIIQSGKLGDIVFVEGKYIHDCKELSMENGELTWRGNWNTKEGLNNYPTHSLGPICRWLEIGENQKDSIQKISNTFSSNKTLVSYFKNNSIYETVTQPDIVFSNILTKNGVTIHLRYDTKSNRPNLKNGYEIQGTLGWIQSGRIDEEEPVIYYQKEREMFPLRQSPEYRKALASLKYDWSQYERKSVNFTIFYYFVQSVLNGKSNLSLEDAILWSSPIWV
ncbi:MAG: Gfo/Idh/MocA family oxidoreductase [Leptospiraceae bacterium]|nr:Gfo/Idh/MocA family oxidoreductase [Leptospiraceae bacterium]